MKNYDSKELREYYKPFLKNHATKPLQTRVEKVLDEFDFRRENSFRISN